MRLDLAGQGVDSSQSWREETPTHRAAASSQRSDKTAEGVASLVSLMAGPETWASCTSVHGTDISTATWPKGTCGQRHGHL